LRSCGSRKARRRMFGFVTRSWNPVVGCLHDCYNGRCWAKVMARRLCSMGFERYEGFRPKLVEGELSRSDFRPGELIFVSSMGDLFGEWVPRDWILRVLDVVGAHPRTTFFLETKNPSRYREFIARVPGNVILSATIETNLDDVACSVSKAPPPSERYEAMRSIRWLRKHVSVEPVLRFDPEVFPRWIRRIGPILASVGYDNYGARLPEPPLRDVMGLIRDLEDLGVRVERKTLRRAWWEGG